MRLVSYADEFVDAVREATWEAVQDAAHHAARLPGAPRDLHADRISPTAGRIGSDKPYAKAQEEGAFIRPRRGGKALRFASGRFSKYARIRAKHYLRKTGARWGQFLLPRLRAVGR